jgi:hypothetical protein
MVRDPVIPDRGEFIDVLAAMRRGCVLVRLSDNFDGCWVGGRNVFWSFEPLEHFGLIERFDNPEGFAQVRYYRLNARGEAFAAEARAVWRRQPLLQRVMARLVG